MNINLQNKSSKQEIMAREITRSNVIILSLYDFVEDYLNLKNKDPNLSKNREIVAELDPILFLVKAINNERIKAKTNGIKLIINFNVKKVKAKNNKNQTLPTDLNKLEKIMSMSDYYHDVIEKWIFSLELMANKKMTDDIYDFILNQVAKKEIKINDNWNFKNHTSKAENLTVQISNEIKKPKRINEYLNNFFNKSFQSIQQL